jgi:hypothetical protein
MPAKGCRTPSIEAIRQWINQGAQLAFISGGDLEHARDGASVDFCHAERVGGFLCQNGSPPGSPGLT